MEIKTKRINNKEISEGLEIYNYFINHSTSNFEEKNLTKKKFIELFNKSKDNKLPFIIAKENKEVIGLAFVNKFREKSGYRFSFEHSIYVNPKHIDKGYGSIILKELIKECKKNKNIKNLIAVIGGSDNVSSIKIHEKNGFIHIGTLKKVGYKKNKWIDSVYMQKRL